MVQPRQSQEGGPFAMSQSVVHVAIETHPEAAPAPGPLRLSPFWLLFAALALAMPGHRACMPAALTASARFLAAYLPRVALTRVHRFPLGGGIRIAYLTLLGSHTILAVLALPLVLRTVWLSLVRERFPQHRRIA